MLITSRDTHAEALVWPMESSELPVLVYSAAAFD